MSYKQLNGTVDFGHCAATHETRKRVVAKARYIYRGEFFSRVYLEGSGDFDRVIDVTPEGQETVVSSEFFYLWWYILPTRNKSVKTSGYLTVGFIETPFFSQTCTMEYF